MMFFPVDDMMMLMMFFSVDDMMMFFSIDDIYDDVFFHICIFSYMYYFFKLLVDIDFRLVHFITDFRLVDQFSAFYVCCILG